MTNEFSQKKKEKIQKQLEKKLGNEFLSIRTGYGSVRLTYVEGWKIIELANNIFGFDGWSSEIRSLTEEYVDVSGDKVNVGYSCVCRVTLKNGSYREDIGFGSAENQKIKAMAIQKAKKEAATDALKRALRQFGNALGNCCYDKEYIRSVQKMPGSKALDTKKTLKQSDLDGTLTQNSDVSSLSFSKDNELSDFS